MAIGVFVLFAFRVGHFDLFGLAAGKARTIETMLLATETLETGAKVTIGGVRVGSVEEMRIATPEESSLFRTSFSPEVWSSAYAANQNPLVIVRFKIEKKAFLEGQDLSLSRSNSRVFLQQEGFLGTHFLEIEPGLPATDGDSLFASSGDQMLRLVAENRGLMAVLMRELKPTQERINLLLDRLNNGLFSPENTEELTQILSNLSSMTRKADAGMDLINELLGTGPTSVREKLLEPTSQLIGTAQASLSSLQLELDNEILPRFRGLLDGGRSTVSDLRLAIQRADSLIATNAPFLEKILSDFAAATDGLAARLDRTEAMIEVLGREMKNLLSSSNQTVSENRAEISEIMRSMRRMAWEFEIFSRKLRSNPGVLIWGDDEKPLEALPMDQERNRRAGRAAPFDQREEKREK
jgi:ABC-type transporter Mla subunit MlaD